MQTKFFSILFLLILSCWQEGKSSNADNNNRGYYSAPYYRYEAEPNLCDFSDAEFLSRSDNQKLVQSEATNQSALLLKQGGKIKWLNNTGDADGLTIRFSIPDENKGFLRIDCNNDSIDLVEISSKHSWQYCEATNNGSRNFKPEKYPYKSPLSDDCPLVRMRFDETHTRLNKSIQIGDSISIINLSDVPVIIDFIEIEKVVKKECPENAIIFTGDNLREFISKNPGQTIYIPEGNYTLDGIIDLNGGEGTVLTGAGMWFTNLYFISNDNFTAGIFSNKNHTKVSDLYMSSGQTQRYTPGPYTSPGKGFMGCWGDSSENTSLIENVWVEHFECGAWLADYTDGLLPGHVTFRDCRFRNNYADGINLCRGANNCIVENCNFRNNGDDDMASWSADGFTCHDNIYRFCTAENNWRASSLGFFGGYGHKAENLLIKDGLESGVRLVSDFGGADFKGSPIEFRNITIEHCGCAAGKEGESGDFWGLDQGALHIEASLFYDIDSPIFDCIDIIDSRNHGVFIGSLNHTLNSLQLKNIKVRGLNNSDSYGFFFENAVGFGKFSNCSIDPELSERLTNLPSQNTDFIFE